MSALRFTLLLATLAWLLAGPDAPAKTAHEPQTPWYDGLGRYERPIQTKVDGAQGYFNQGLVFLMAGQADEALRSFKEAARFDPRCAMAHWGIALAQGPRLGVPKPGARAEAAAVAALNRAHELAAKGSPVEQALVSALGRRHRDPPPDDRRPLDEEYARAMVELQRLYPDDADIQAWAAEALMIAAQVQDAPAEGERLREQAAEAVGLALEQRPEHPLANRLTVLCAMHSASPERGDAAAERLRELAPGVSPFAALAARHDARRGRWGEAVETGLKALAADARYRELSGSPPESHRLTMVQHRLGVVHAAVMSGRRELALEQARAVVADLPADWLPRHREKADGYVAAPILVLVKFGEWEAALAEPKPADGLPLAAVLHHAARGLALVERGDLAAAREEAVTCERMSTEARVEDRAKKQAAARWAQVTTRMLTCRLLLAEGRFDDAVKGLEQAVQEEESLPWSMDMPMLLPARHALAAVLLQAEDLTRAAQVYEADLERWPENGWALDGLAKAKLGAGEREAADAVRERLLDSWKTASSPRTGWAWRGSADTSVAE